MTKFSVIFPYFNRPFHLKWCINSLLAQTFKDIEIIIIGEKIYNERETTVNGIKIINIEYIDTLNLSKMMNIAVEISTGEYLQFWQSDFIIFQNYFSKLNSYVEQNNNDILYVSRVLDIRIPTGDSIRENVINKPEIADHMDACIHRSVFEPFYSGFYGIYTHWYVDWLCRMWEIKKLKFTFFKDLEIIHMPHDIGGLTQEMQIMEANLSYEIFHILRYELKLNYKLYYLLDKKSMEIKNKILEIRKNIK